MSSDSERYTCDDWSSFSDGQEYDGKQLLALKIEIAVGSTVTDIPIVTRGSNNLGLHCKLSVQREILVRLGRSDVNMPNYDGFGMDFLLGDMTFETEVYGLLEHSEIPVSRLLYFRLPAQYPGPATDVPADLAGQRVIVFEKVDGRDNVWGGLSVEGKRSVLTQAPRIRASLFKFVVPADFAETWFLPRTFKFMPKQLPLPFAPTREFWTAILRSKIEATIGEEAETIGWEDDNNIVGPRAAKAKQSLLRFISHLLPGGVENEWLYRPVLEHGDYGVHNMSVMVDISGKPRVTSLYDWETGYLVPAILADPEMAVFVDLTADESGRPRITRVDGDVTPDYCSEYMNYAAYYLKDLYSGAPGFQRAIVAGGDVRYLWFALKNWRGEEPEEFFGSLGDWADRRISEAGA
ncbi:hypothetical protein MFIFM68171_04921 [Madurella fahalii]|uniref:Aminoglycoside phosphotransferase domain-containing protein n=1 Tax=Madurella fahalii TaxID=1157608 RepID=A0ABQ0GAG1_9PEZI